MLHACMGLFRGNWILTKPNDPFGLYGSIHAPLISVSSIRGRLVCWHQICLVGLLDVFEKRVEHFLFLLRGGKFELSSSVPVGTAILDLRDAKARILSNAENSWPKSKNLRLQGFMFNELGGHAKLDAKTQIKWLRLQEPFVAQPYEQMAAVFLNMGYQEEGVDISIAEIGMQDG